MTHHTTEAERRTCVFAGGRQAGSSCLHFLISQQESLGLSVIGVLDSGNLPGRDNASVTHIAREAQVPVLAFADLDALLPVDFLVSVQYDKIFPLSVLERVNRLAVNLHMAPLPEYRGSSQFAFAVLDRAPTFGATLHEMTSGVDSGPILAERRFTVSQDAFACDLYDLTTDAAVSLFQDSAGDLFSGGLKPVNQSHLVGQRHSSFHRREELNELRRIPATLTLSDQLTRFRATYFPPFPGPVLVDGVTEIELDLDWFERTRRAVNGQ